MTTQIGFLNPDPNIQTPIVYVDEPPQWEYKSLVRSLAKEAAPDENELNALGKDGWELCGVFSDSPFVYFYFKREKK